MIFKKKKRNKNKDQKKKKTKPLQAHYTDGRKCEYNK